MGYNPTLIFTSRHGYSTLTALWPTNHRVEIRERLRKRAHHREHHRQPRQPDPVHAAAGDPEAVKTI